MSSKIIGGLEGNVGEALKGRIQCVWGTEGILINNFSNHFLCCNLIKAQTHERQAKNECEKIKEQPTNIKEK